MRQMRSFSAAILLLTALPAVASSESLKEFAATCDRVIGVTVPEFDCEAGALVPDTHPHGDSCDRPQQLSQICDPGSRFQVLVDNEKALIVAHCRKGGKEPGKYKDIAVIQYSKTKGATCFYQALGVRGRPTPDGRMPAPSTGAEAWLSPAEAQSEEPCGECHDNGPILRSPYLAQITGANALPGAGDETFNSDQPYCILGDAFAGIKAYKVEIKGNVCNNCHRMGVNNQSDDNGTAREFGIRATAASQTNKNPHSVDSPIWMPPEETIFDQANFDAANAIKACGERLKEEPLPNTPTCKITQFARGVDGCLLGTWEATKVTQDRTKGDWVAAWGDALPDGGAGFRVTFKCDGTQTVDYSTMKPFTGTAPGAESARGLTSVTYSGTTTGHITTKDHIAIVEDRDPKPTGRKTLALKSSSNKPIVYSLIGLGPGALGETLGGASYTCTDDTLEYSGALHHDRVANFAITLKRQKD